MRSTAHPLAFRPAAEADLTAAYDVFVAAEGELWRRHGFPWTPAPFDTWRAPHRHLLAQDGERAVVALDGDRLAGYSTAVVRGDAWFLSALFVSPPYQGRGVGRRLLDLSWGTGHHHRMTITDAIQPASNNMYARRGLLPTTPILTLSGEPACRPPDGLEAVTPHPEALARLDRAAYGFEREADHRFWHQQPTQATLWLRRGEPIAYSYVNGQGLIGPLAGCNAEAAATALRAELARRHSRPATVHLPGSARRLVETALASGLRTTGPPGLLLLNDTAEPPQALAISGYLLF